MSSENNFDYLPYFTEGKVVRGFGRGGAELGIPTANFPDEVIHHLPEDFVCGVYYGWACVNTLSHDVYKMVMCCGWNTHFNNKVKTMETHIMHKFDEQFYDENLRIIVLGYIRPMEAYDSLDALIKAVNNDIHQSDMALSQPAMAEFSQHPFLAKGRTETTDVNCTTTNTTRNPALSLEDTSNICQDENNEKVDSPSFSSTSLNNISNGDTGELSNGACCHHQHRHQSRGIVSSEDQKSSTKGINQNGKKWNGCADSDCLSSGYGSNTSSGNDEIIDCDRNSCDSKNREKKASHNEAAKQEIKFRNRQHSDDHSNDFVIKNGLNKL